MPYAFRQVIIDALINDDGSFTTGTLFDRAWMQSILSDFNAGFRVAKADAEPAVDIDAPKAGIVAGLGGNSAPDMGWFRYTDGWRARNAANTVYRQVEVSAPTTVQAAVNLDYFNNNQLAQPGSVPVGGMMEYIALADPGVQTDLSEWVIADGRALLRASYPDLDALLFANAYPFGNGDGSTTFNIPDRRGWIGIGTGGVPALALGDTAGAWDHTHTYVDLPEHNHGVTDAGHVHAVTDAGHAHGVTDAGHTHVITDLGHVHGITDGGHTHVLDEGLGHTHVLTDGGHTHVIADPGHDHALAGTGHTHTLDGLGSHTHAVENDSHSHALTDPTHSHVLNDSGHGHTGSAAAHTHTVTDPGHGHTINDPQHDHNATGLSFANHTHDQGSLVANNFAKTTVQSGSGVNNTMRDVSGGESIPVDGDTGGTSGNVTGNTGTRATGISINNNATGISLANATPAVTVDNNTTGVSLNASSSGITVDAAATGITLGLADLSGATIDPATVNGTIDTKVTGVTANSASTGVTMATNGTGATIDSAGTGITVDSQVAGISMATTATGVTVDSDVTGVTVDSQTTGVTIDNAGIVAPETDPANPPVLALTYIMRVA